MINNFQQIKNLLEFTSSDDYYFVQILMRSKDHENLGSNNRLIKTYSIKSKEALDKYESEIKTLCETFKARAYIHLTKRSFKKVAFLMMKELCDRITNDQCPEISRIFNTASGNFIGSNKTWVVDVDVKDMELVKDIIKFINNDCEPAGNKCIDIINTPNGYHIISDPFNVHHFLCRYTGIDIHKNNPTILYVS